MLLVSGSLRKVRLNSLPRTEDLETEVFLLNFDVDICINLWHRMPKNLFKFHQLKCLDFGDWTGDSARACAALARYVYQTTQPHGKLLPQEFLLKHSYSGAQTNTYTEQK